MSQTLPRPILLGHACSRRAQPGPNKHARAPARPLSARGAAPPTTQCVRASRCMSIDDRRRSPSSIDCIGRALVIAPRGHARRWCRVHRRGRGQPLVRNRAEHTCTKLWRRRNTSRDSNKATVRDYQYRGEPFRRATAICGLLAQTTLPRPCPRLSGTSARATRQHLTRGRRRGRAGDAPSDGGRRLPPTEGQPGDLNERVMIATSTRKVET